MREELKAAAGSMFDGIPAEAITEVLGPLERRSFPAGSVVIAEGETHHELYWISAGEAEVVVSDRQGDEHVVGRVSASTTVGEMSLFTGQPASSTVRALSELEVLVIPQRDFEALASRFPEIYRHLGALLSERLARTNRLTVRQDPAKLIVLDDQGAPALLGYALASSLAWHSRRSTALLVVGDDPGDELEALSRAALPPDPQHPRATVIVLPPGPHDQLVHKVSELADRFEYVLVQAAALETPLESQHRLTLTGPSPRDDSEPAGLRIATLSGWSPSGDDERPRGGRLVVPALTTAAEHGLAQGMLDLGSPAGRSLGRASRQIAGYRVGIALGAGSVMGFAHFGVVRACERLGIPVDAIAGTSVGAAAGSLLSLGHDVDTASEIFVECGNHLVRLTISRKGILSNRSLRRFLQSVSPDGRIEDLPIAYAAVAADLTDQREVVFRRGLLWQAVLASISIPGIYPALKIGPYTVVDGGVLNPVPTSVASDLGTDVIIGVKLSSTMAEADLNAEAVEAVRGGEPSVLTTIMRAVEIMQSRIAPQPTSSTTFMLAPKLTDIPTARLRAFREGKRYEIAGEAAVEEALPRLAAALPWLQR